MCLYIVLGTLYTWGNGKKGQLGHGNVDDLNVNSPKLGIYEDYL